MENVNKSQAFAYNLECPAYNESMTLGISNFFKTNQFTDVTLSAEGKFVRSHQVVLAAISPYFEKMFKLGAIGVNPVIVFGDILFEDLLGLLRYIYTGKISVPESHMARFIKAGQSLLVKGFETVIDKDPIYNEANENHDPSEATPKTAGGYQPSAMTDLTNLINTEEHTMKNMLSEDKLSDGQELHSALQGQLIDLEETTAQESQSQPNNNEKTSNENFCTENTNAPSRSKAKLLESAQLNEVVLSKRNKIFKYGKLSLQASDRGDEKVPDRLEKLRSCQSNLSLEESTRIINETDFNSEPCKFCGEVVEGSSKIGKKLKQHQKKCSKNPKHEKGMCVICEKFVGENRLARHFNIKHGVP